jgi:hypothetical protein
MRFGVFVALSQQIRQEVPAPDQAAARAPPDKRKSLHGETAMEIGKCGR